jgi:transposase-like protein
VERKWKERYKQKFRRRAVARMNACENITRLSLELGVSRGLLTFVEWYVAGSVDG